MDSHHTASGGTPEVIERILDHLPVGVSLVDGDLRVVAINRAFLRLLDFPAELFAAGRPSLETLARFNAARGEYGPGDPEEHVRRRLDLARRFEAHQFTRRRPDGTVLEITGAPLPGGGFVTIYSDVTAQHAAEESARRKALYLEAVVSHLPQGISVFDADLKLKVWNDNLLQVLDLPPEAVYQDVPFEDLIMYPARRGEYGPGDPQAQVAERRALASRFEAHRFERTRPNGRTHLVEGRPMREDGRIVGFVGSYTDITEEIAARRELQQKNEVFQTLVDNIPGGVTLFGAAPDFRLVACNDEFKRLLEFPDTLFTPDARLADFFRYNAARGEYGPLADEAAREAHVAALLERAARREPHVFERARPNGTVLEVRGLPLADGSFVTIYADVTAQRRAAEAIERLARRDALTGLANRYTLEARLDQTIADAHRHGRRLAVMFIDLDDFKGINDTRGHAVGDEFLVAMAGRLADAVRESDVVARLGGDEFVVVQTDVRDGRDIARLAARIVDVAAQPVRVGPHELRSAASVGICVYPDDGADRGALMQRADIAMYHAKSSGKGVFRFFDPQMMQEASRRIELEAALRRAVEGGEFEIHLQPIFRLGTQALFGFEALLRWRRADGTLTPPADFIPLAEETRLIVPIGRWVLREVCATQRRFADAGLPPVRIAVNLSARQFRVPDLAGEIAALLEEHGLPGDRLALEITESVAMDDPADAIRTLQALKRLGVRIAIDDFGTGYSSLAYLKALPIDELKLDRSFVKDIETDPNDAAICRATIGLAHSLGLSVIAEGIETPRQAAWLADLGCDFAQGFLLGRPAPVDVAAGLLRRPAPAMPPNWMI